MISERELQDLVAFKAPAGEVLSLYLNVDPHRRIPEKYKLALRHQLNTVSELADPADVARVERYFDLEYDGQGRGVACFSCQAADFWRAFPLQMPVEDTVFLGDHPFVKPLNDVLDTYARHGVALVSREAARFFVFEQGEAEEVGSMIGDDVKRHKQGGWASSRYQRHEDAAAYRNLKEVAEATAAFCREHDCRRLILAGTEKTVAQFQPLLPKSLQGRVVGSLAMNMSASATEVAERSLEITREAAQQQQAALVQKLISAASSKGGAGALGLADTLRLLEEGRVHRLLVAEGYHDTAHRCVNCGYMTVEPMEQCRFCGGHMRLLPDAVNGVVSRAIERGVEVTTVRGSTELEAAGSIGAILRY
jgi:peptide subunit release factor 1 (eRF1)